MGHLKAAQLFISQMQLNQLVFVPAGKPWQKLKTHTLASANDRLNMLQLAIADLTTNYTNELATKKVQITIDESELNHLHNSYTIEMLIKWRQTVGADAIIFFLVGSDQFISLNTWYRWLDLFKYANICVVSRAVTNKLETNTPSLNQENLDPQLKAEIKLREQPLIQLPYQPSGHIYYLPTFNYSISSTQIRLMLSQQSKIESISDFQADFQITSQMKSGRDGTQKTELNNQLKTVLPKAVLNYIKKHSLYY